MDQIWPALLFSALSAAAFLCAIGLGLRTADIREGKALHEAETRARRVAIAAGGLLIVAAVLWTVYFVFGPLQDAVTNLAGRD